jgi:hypothetical protein
MRVGLSLGDRRVWLISHTLRGYVCLFGEPAQIRLCGVEQVNRN